MFNVFDKEIVRDQARYYDSFYLYDERQIVARIEELKSHFPSVRFLYSVKCNPHAKVLRRVFAQGFGADAASAGEVRAALAAGLSGDDIYYSAPGKTEKDIESAIESSVLIADSIGEIERIQAIAARRNIVADIGVRINPSVSFDGGAGASSKFGIDEVEAITLAHTAHFPNIRLAGIHVHLRSQELNADVLSSYYENVLRLARRVQGSLAKPLAFVNMGSGMGIPYAADDKPLDIGKLGEAVQEAVSVFQNEFPSTQIIIETGRYVVGNAGVYATKVTDRKLSCGKSYVILANTLNGFIRPSLSCLVIDRSPDRHLRASEPLFTSESAFQFVALDVAGPIERVDLVGNLCTAADVVATDVLIPRLEVGDVVVMTNAGAYAAVLSPMQFSSHEPPVELVVTLEGEVEK